MIRTVIALIALFSLVHASNLAVSVKERLVSIPAGSTVEVKLIDGQKIKGRLGAVSDQSFEVQTAKEGRVVVEKVAFSDVKSAEQKGEPRGTATKVVLWSLAGFGIFCLILIGVCLGGACDS